MSTKLLLKQQIAVLKSTASVTLFVGGLGSGKSYIASLKAMIALLEGRHIIVTAQSYKSLKLVLFEEILQRLRENDIPFELNKADMTIILHQTGGKVFGFSVDSVEQARGITADMLIMDEAALADAYTYRVLQGRLRRPGYNMQTILITTPRGTDNWIYDISLRDDVAFIHQKTTDNLFLPPGFYEQLLLDYEGDEQLMRQELDATFETFGADNTIISPMDYRRATENKPNEPLKEDRIFMGFDVARKGKDRSAVVVRHGDVIKHYEMWRDTDIVDSCDKVTELVIRHKVECLVVDGVGLGAGAYDILKRNLSTVCEVVNYNGAFRAIGRSEKYSNARAESMFLLRNWMLNGGSIPNNEAFKEMTSITYKLDAKGKIQLVSKKDLMTSPDLVDALSITFSSKVKQVAKPKRKNNSNRGTFIG